MLALLPSILASQALQEYNITWNSQSNHSAESMPLGGGDIGMNVWVENDEVLCYFSRSGTFDEVNTLLKGGRVRLKISPNPFTAGDFEQVLNLQDGNVLIRSTNDSLQVSLNLWVEIAQPVIHVDLTSSIATSLEATYENWRFEDRITTGKANYANSFKWSRKQVLHQKDSIAFAHEGVLFFHQNADSTIFDLTVAQQGLEPVKHKLYNPLKNLIFGGLMSGPNLQPQSVTTGRYMDTPYKGWQLSSKQPARNHQLRLTLHTSKAEQWEHWASELMSTHRAHRPTARQQTIDWWHQFWNTSFINIRRQEQDSVWQTGRNYQLFRYMLGCNAYGSSPTKFNGGLFTYDPSSVDSTYRFSPDHRNWGGGVHTAQNQRLVYFPMLKSGDFDLMTPQFDYYLALLHNAELRSQQYWGHNGGCFTEQIENFGLPNYAEYGSRRPEGYDPGRQYNAWLEYQWDTILEFCFMILQTEAYGDRDISPYMPLIESAITFFDEHYQYLASQRGSKSLDDQGDLILYPGSSCETYKMAYNASSTIAGLQVVIERLLQSEYLPQDHQAHWEEVLNRIPPIPFRTVAGKKVIAPARLWERINNTEAPQLYPVYPWGLYGIGKPDLEVARNTYLLDPEVQQFKSHVGWKQYNIWAARLGMTQEAATYTVLKLKDADRRFPAFWGPGFDWVPDHNWGGAGAIGLQEMLLQTNGDSILLFPAWPQDWEVHFKLHAPQNTVVEAELKNGKVNILRTIPKHRKQDIHVLLSED